jgi:hypothetical protein
VVNGSIGTNYTFSMDGAPPNQTLHKPEKSQGYFIYSVTLYEIRGLNDSDHTLSVVVNTFGNRTTNGTSGFLAFDYARVNGFKKSSGEHVHSAFIPAFSLTF